MEGRFDAYEGRFDAYENTQESLRNFEKCMSTGGSVRASGDHYHTFEPLYFYGEGLRHSSCGGLDVYSR